MASTIPSLSYGPLRPHPAQTQADIGISIASGTVRLLVSLIAKDIAADAASIVLIKNDLRDVITAIDLSRTVFRRIRYNFVWALGYNIIGASPTVLTAKLFP